MISQQRRKERKVYCLINRRDAEGAEFFIVFAGATLVANNPGDRDEFAAEACAERRRRAAPTDCDQFNLQA